MEVKQIYTLTRKFILFLGQHVKVQSICFSIERVFAFLACSWLSTFFADMISLVKHFYDELQKVRTQNKMSLTLISSPHWYRSVITNMALQHKNNV